MTKIEELARYVDGVLCDIARSRGNIIAEVSAVHTMIGYISEMIVELERKIDAKA